MLPYRNLLLLLFLTSAAFAAEPPPIALDKPVRASLAPDQFYYSFDHGISPLPNEGGSGAHEGQPVAGSFSMPEMAEGRFGQALRLSGGQKTVPLTRNPYLHIADGGEWNADTLSAFTLGLWIKCDVEMLFDEATRIVFLDKGGAGYRGEDSGGFSFYLQRPADEPGGERWELVFETRHNQRIISVRSFPILLPLSDHSWHHLAIAFDSEAQAVMFWVDGIAVDPLSPSVDSTLQIAPTPRGTVLGERQTNAYWSTFRGTIDDFFLTSGFYTFTPLTPPTNP